MTKNLHLELNLDGSSWEDALQQMLDALDGLEAKYGRASTWGESFGGTLANLSVLAERDVDAEDLHAAMVKLVAPVS